MSKITELASTQLNGHDAVTVELIEADDTPAAVIIRWPFKPSVVHPTVPRGRRNAGQAVR
jgi:hypothetical protein